MVLPLNIRGGEFFQKFDKTMCKIYEINVTDEQYENIKILLGKMIKRKFDYKYDYFGILPRFLGIPITLKNRYVCSYFVATLLEKTHICSFNKEAYFIKPSDFENIKGSREIYKGSFALYNG